MKKLSPFVPLTERGRLERKQGITRSKVTHTRKIKERCLTVTLLQMPLGAPAAGNGEFEQIW